VIQDRGSYLLVLEMPSARRIRVGKLGTLGFQRGFYVYVGSAMANLSKRIERHRRKRKKFHWHIDYLRAFARFHAVLAVRTSRRLECDIARAMKNIARSCIPRFGSSDCHCRSHLFAMGEDPLESAEFNALLQHFRMERLVRT